MHKLRIATQSFAAITMAAKIASPMSAHAIEYPGPSALFYTNHYYECNINYYVAPAPLGNDGNEGTETHPWLTLEHANGSGKLSGGTCVNVEPGTYSGVWLTKSGNKAASTGYIVYRCTKMDACTVQGTAGPNGNVGFFAATEGGSYPPANYTMIDGFTIVGNPNKSTYAVGVEFVGSSSGVPGVFGSHHDWVLNSVITGFGQGGIGFAEGDYTYALHNTIHGNANAPDCNSYAQGSGLGDLLALDIGVGYPNYVPTPDDKVNPNPAIGSLMNGSSWFHKVYSFNVVYNNYLSPCSNGNDTDGNNIILDTFGSVNGNELHGQPYDYPDQTLIAFNKVYNGGGGGIHVFASEYATVANNSSYNNHLDPYEQSGGAAIDTIESYGDTVINNIAVGIPANNNGTCAFYSTPYAKFNNAIQGSLLQPTKSVPNPTPDTFSHNITMLMGGNNSCWGNYNEDPPTGEIGLWNGDTYSTNIVNGVPANMVNTNPKWQAVGQVSTGTESTRPVNTNFALQPGSPAIGYGLTETYLPAQSVDVGACSHNLTTC
jgi:hypothetical protein